MTGGELAAESVFEINKLKIERYVTATGHVHNMCVSVVGVGSPRIYHQTINHYGVSPTSAMCLFFCRCTAEIA